MNKSAGRIAVLICGFGLWFLPSSAAALCSGGCLPSQSAPACLKCGFTLYSREICLSGGCGSFCDTLSCEVSTSGGEESSQASSCQAPQEPAVSAPPRPVKVVKLEARI